MRSMKMITIGLFQITVLRMSFIAIGVGSAFQLPTNVTIMWIVQRMKMKKTVVRHLFFLSGLKYLLN
jgi:hypothetical protein